MKTKKELMLELKEKFKLLKENNLTLEKQNEIYMGINEIKYNKGWTKCDDNSELKKDKAYWVIYDGETDYILKPMNEEIHKNKKVNLYKTIVTPDLPLWIK